MDESKLSELLRDAVADAPAPTFDQHDVARASARQRVRARNSVLAGAALGVALLAGTTALSVALWTGTDSSGQSNAVAGDSAPGNGSAAPYELEEERAADAPSDEPAGDNSNSSPESRKQGRTSAEGAGPAGPGSTPGGCEQADRELAAALAGELPAAALSGRYSCQPDMTNVTYRLDGGVLTVMLLDRRGLMGSADEPGLAVRTASADTGDGRVVVIFSTAPEPGPPPLADELDELAAGVAARY